jgi:hypothetical protein
MLHGTHDYEVPCHMSQLLFEAIAPKSAEEAVSIGILQSGLTYRHNSHGTPKEKVFVVFVVFIFYLLL